MTHAQSIDRECEVANLAESLRQEMTMVDFIDAIEHTWNNGQLGEAFANECVELARTGSDKAQLGELILKAVERYFISVANDRVR